MTLMQKVIGIYVNGEYQSLGVTTVLESTKTQELFHLEKEINV